MKNISIWIFLCTIVVASSTCDNYDDCVTCTNHRSWSGNRCRWCPLDNECHAFGSLANACKSNMNIKLPSDCYKESDKEFSPDNAFVGTLLSAAAYSQNPEQCLKQALPNTDFQLVHVVGRQCDDFIFDYGECFAYIAISHTSRTIILSYRGTTSTKQMIDQVLTILTIPKTSFTAGGEVQRYFKNAHNKLYPCIKRGISELINEFPDYNVTITGHSLGGAIASLASAALVEENMLKNNEMHLYTYGMPRVGDKKYALEHDKRVPNSWRVVHYRDIVSHFPTCNLITGCSVTNGPFHHGKEIYYNSKDMHVSSNFKICNGNEDSSCSNGDITMMPCTFDMATCIKYHKRYYGIDVGKYCNDLSGGGRGVRSAIAPFPNDTCQLRRFPYKADRKSTSSTSESCLVKGDVFKVVITFVIYLVSL